MSKTKQNVHAAKAKTTPRQTKPWHLPAREADGDESPDQLYTAVGKALSNWEQIENQLANLFATLVGAKIKANPAPAVRAYGTIVSFKSRSAMLDAAARAYFYSRPKLGHQENGLIWLSSLTAFPIAETTSPTASSRRFVSPTMKARLNISSCRVSTCQRNIRTTNRPPISLRRDKCWCSPHIF